METRVRVGHQTVRAGGLSRAGGGDVEHAFSGLLDARSVNGVDSVLAREDASDRPQHPTLELAVVGGAEENDGVRLVAVMSGYLLVLDAVKGVDVHVRVGGRDLAREPLPFLDPVPV